MRHIRRIDIRDFYLVSNPVRVGIGAKLTSSNLFGPCILPRSRERAKVFDTLRDPKHSRVRIPKRPGSHRCREFRVDLDLRRVTNRDGDMVCLAINNAAT